MPRTSSKSLSDDSDDGHLRAPVIRARSSTESEISLDSYLDDDAINDLCALADELAVDIYDVLDAMRRGEARAEAEHEA